MVPLLSALALNLLLLENTSIMKFLNAVGIFVVGIKIGIAKCLNAMGYIISLA